MENYTRKFFLIGGNLKKAFVIFAITALLSILFARPGQAKGEYEGMVRDNKIPLQEGIRYRMPDCNPSDPEAPCYISFYKSTTDLGRQVDQIVLPSSVQTLTCGINVYTNLNVLVMKLWEDITVTWRTTDFVANSGDRGTWVANGLYSWGYLSGPNPTPNGQSYSYSSHTKFQTTGVTMYLGLPYGYYPEKLVEITVTGNQNWSCYVYQFAW